MSRLPLRLLSLLLVTLLMPGGQAQRRREPLTEAEIDQLRDQAQEPNLRLKLYIKFARERLDALDKMRSDPKTTDRGGQTHEGLQNFLDVYDELNQNIDTYEDRKADFRKALNSVIEADIEFQAKLRALQSSSNTNPAEIKVYEFLLQTALDTVDSSLKDHREVLAEQEQEAKHKKKPSNKSAYPE
jgi:uncharacterized coiled-coil DUF342 family protein